MPLLNLKKQGIILLIIGATIGVLGGSIITIGWEARQNAIMALNGELNPFPVDLSKPFVVQLAKVYFNSPLTDINFTSAQLANGIDMNQIFPAANGVNSPFTTNQLKIEFINNQLSVSVNIKDSDNITIAQIVNNEWKTVNPDSLLFWDRNYNAYGFEIIGSDNVPTFQVIMVGPNRIQIGGLFYTANGSIYFEPRSDGTMLYINESSAQLESAHIGTIFKYPALTDPNNLGKMTESYYPSSNPLSDSTWIMIIGFILAIVGPILFAFGFEKYKESSKKAKFHQYLITQYGQRNSGHNDLYYKPRKKGKDKKKHTANK